MPLLAKINYYQLYNPWKYYCGAGRMFERAKVLGGCPGDEIFRTPYWPGCKFHCYDLYRV